MATSAIVDTVPADNTKVQKSALRGNFVAAKSEINRLFRRTGKAWQIATGVETV